MHGAERPVSSTRGAALVQPGEPLPPELPIEKKMELVANEKLQKAGMFMKGQGDKLELWFKEMGDDAKKKVRCVVTAQQSPPAPPSSPGPPPLSPPLPHLPPCQLEELTSREKDPEHLYDSGPLTDHQRNTDGTSINHAPSRKPPSASLFAEPPPFPCCVAAQAHTATTRPLSTMAPTATGMRRAPHQTAQRRLRRSTMVSSSSARVVAAPQAPAAATSNDRVLVKLGCAFA